MNCNRDNWDNRLVLSRIHRNAVPPTEALILLSEACHLVHNLTLALAEIHQYARTIETGAMKQRIKVTV